MKVAQCEVIYKFLNENELNELHILDLSRDKPIKSLTNGVEEVLRDIYELESINSETKVYLYTTDSELVLFNHNTRNESEKFHIVSDWGEGFPPYIEYITKQSKGDFE